MIRIPNGLGARAGTTRPGPSISASLGGDPTLGAFSARRHLLAEAPRRTGEPFGDIPLVIIERLAEGFR
jgi:hypothetical protein